MHRMRFLKNMYHNIMDIDIDCPKPKVGLCGPSEDWTLNYFEYIFKHVLFESIQKKFTKIFIAFIKILFKEILDYPDFI